MLRQRSPLGALAVALAILMAPRPAPAQYPVGDRPSEMTVGRSYTESYGPGYTFYTPSAEFAGSYNFYPGKYTGDYRPGRFATPDRYFSTASPRYTPTLMTSLYYPEVYGSYAMRAGSLSPAAPAFYARLPVEVPLREEVAELTARAEPVARPALIDVSLPSQAALSFQGVPMTGQTGGSRAFQSPPLTPGRNYTYDLRATWKDRDGKEVVQTRRLTVRAGDRLEVDLNRELMPPAGELEDNRSELRTQPLRDLRRTPRE